MDNKNIFLILKQQIGGILPDYLEAFGEILLCLVFLIFMYFFKNIFIFLLKKIVFIFYKDKENLEEIFSKISRSLFVFIGIWAIFLCVKFYFYPNALNDFVLRGFKIAFNLSICYILINVLNNIGVLLIAKIIKGQNKKDIINLLIKVLNCFIVLIGILGILANFGVDISAIIASLGIGGLAVALATKDIIANFFASVLLAFDDSFSQGDWVIVNGVEGIIVETGLRKTSIRTFDNTLVFLPNSSVLGGNITNFSKRKLGRKMVLTIGLTYDTTQNQLKQFLKDITHLIENDENIAQSTHLKKAKQKDFVSINDLEGYRASQYIWIDEFADSSINVKLYFYTKTTSAVEFYKVKSDLMLKIMHLVESSGLGFAFPSQSVYIESLPKTKGE